MEGLRLENVTHFVLRVSVRAGARGGGPVIPGVDSRKKCSPPPSQPRPLHTHSRCESHCGCAVAPGWHGGAGWVRREAQLLAGHVRYDDRGEDDDFRGGELRRCATSARAGPTATVPYIGSVSSVCVPRRHSLPPPRPSRAQTRAGANALAQAMRKQGHQPSVITGACVRACVRACRIHPQRWWARHKLGRRLRCARAKENAGWGGGGGAPCDERLVHRLRWWRPQPQ